MGRRTMASPNEAQQSQFPLAVLNQDASFYGHPSFNDVQSQYPKPLHVTALSEFSNPAFVAGQQNQTLTSSSSSYPTTNFSTFGANYYPNGNFGRKSIDEACLDMQEEQHADEKHASFDGASLEAFLALGGGRNSMLNGESQPLLAVDPMVQEHDKWHGHQWTEQHQTITLLGSNLPRHGNGILNTGFVESQELGMPMVSMSLTRPTLSNSKVPMEMNRNDENIDKSTERRHKRMIKNRESAARSRAKKQDYINKLREDADKLQARKEELRKQREPFTSFDPTFQKMDSG